MRTKKDIDRMAEHIIQQYVGDVGCETLEDIANVLELLMSKASRGIEKVVDNNRACDATYKTFMNISTYPAIKEDPE